MTNAKLGPADLPDWPRLLGRDLAAAYVGVSPNTFEATVPVPPIRIGRRELWDKARLDAWVDSLAGDGQAPGGFEGALAGYR